MFVFSRISNYLTDWLYVSLPGIDPKKREEIEYGIYMAISEILKISLLLILSIVLRVFLSVFAVITIYGLLRFNLGGVHAKTHWGCFISYILMVYGLVLLSSITRIDRVILDLIIIPFNLIVSYLYAPADMPQKPIMSKKQRKRLRITGFILLAILFVTSQFVTQFWANIILFTCFIQNILMTPFVYKITKNKYGREEVTL